MAGRGIRLFPVWLLVIGLASPHAPGQEFEQAHSGLLRDVQAAQSALGDAQQRVSTARKNLGQELSALEREVNALREQAVTLRRAEDEKTLTLNRLQERLQEWEDQSRFQQNQLGNFLRGTAFAKHAGTDADILDHLQHYTESALAKLTPAWHREEIASASGELQQASTLGLGPVHFFIMDESTGLLGIEDDQPPRMAYQFDSRTGTGLQALHDTGMGLVTFDPTRSRAIQLDQQRETLIEHLLKGGIWVAPILFFALISLLVAAAKSVQMLRIGSAMKSMKEELQAIALDTPPGQLRDDRLLTTLNRQRHRLEQWVGAIAVIAAIAPLLGLLGTVSGMIETFKLMTLFGAGDAQAVSSGISKALITTELGLIVAIPSLLLHAILSRRIRHYGNILEAEAIAFSQHTEGPAK